MQLYVYLIDWLSCKRKHDVVCKQRKILSIFFRVIMFQRRHNTKISHRRCLCGAPPCQKLSYPTKHFDVSILHFERDTLYLLPRRSPCIAHLSFAVVVIPLILLCLSPTLLLLFLLPLLLLLRHPSESRSLSSTVPRSVNIVRWRPVLNVCERM